MNLKRLAPLTLAVALFGCTKKPGPASAEYSKAQGQFLNLLNQKPLDVYGDPSLNGILATLDGVPADSISHDAAVALATQIRAGQADYAKAASDRKDAVANSNKAPDLGGTLSVVSPRTAQTNDTPSPAAVTDGGPSGPVAGPTVDMSAADFNSKFGFCFSRSSTYTSTSNGVDTKGDVYALNEQASCLAKYPSFSGRMVLVSGGKVQRFAAKSDIVSQETLTMTQPGQVQNPNQTPGTNLAGSPPLPGLPTPAQPQPPEQVRPPQNVLPDATPPPPPANTPPQDPNYNPDAVNK